MRLKIDTEGLVLIVGGVEAVTDRDTSAAVIDRDTGKQLFTVHLMAVTAGERPEQLSVRVAGQPTGVGLGCQVKVRELVARTWEIGDRHGLSFRATAIELVVAGQRAQSDSRAA